MGRRGLNDFVMDGHFGRKFVSTSCGLIARMDRLLRDGWTSWLNFVSTSQWVI